MWLSDVSQASDLGVGLSWSCKNGRGRRNNIAKLCHARYHRCMQRDAFPNWCSYEGLNIFVPV